MKPLKPLSQIFAGWLLGIVIGFVLFCLVGAVWDAWAAPSTVNGMVGHAPGGLTYGGYALLCWLIPGFGPLCLLVLLAGLLLFVIPADALFRAARR